MEEMTTQSLSKQASKRIEWLDALKGVAIIAVVFGHSLWDIQKIMLLENTTISFSN